MNKKIKHFIPYLISLIFIFQQMSPFTIFRTTYSSEDNMHTTHFHLNANEDSSINRMDSLNSTLLLSNNVTESFNVQNKEMISDEAVKLTLHLPDVFKYKDINEGALKSYLNTKSSILKDEPYFSSIINVGRRFNINPILLFSITGQEQGFVPQEQMSAVLIANNPYNVFCSWEDYNTDIIDSSEIACRTIINLSKDRPDSVDPLIWINRKYSADQNWHYGVRCLYNEIVEYINNY